ncbi:protoporphyrinogen/coproporphyrinogen oxidase [Lachnoanaerobaculum saburreum]|nr:FAD-dependent oxidoreductase [Lachnoanaerobaculum saburreum]
MCSKNKGRSEKERLNYKMRVVILGGGLAGLSTAYYLQKFDWVDSIKVLESEDRIGGLAKSLFYDGYTYDIGPHIIFSKNKEILNELLDFIEVGTNKIKRSNEIYYKGKLIQYPFENDLSKLPKDDLEYCIRAFDSNPYENYIPQNMLQFFLKTFGEGITNVYLRPYNEKIWKFDPSCMNTSMVERIPKPTKDEIRRSASGETIEGYLHQLYFEYPSTRGIGAICEGIYSKLDTDKCEVLLNSRVIKVSKSDTYYKINTDSGKCVEGELVISTMPVHDLVDATEDVPKYVIEAKDDLKYNSILIAFVRTPYDMYGEHYAYTVPDKNIIFHRISKMDFLGESYHRDGEATFMVEITYRDGDVFSNMTDDAIREKIAKGFVDINIAKNANDVEVLNMTRHKYAYVIYDLNHTTNIDVIRKYYRELSICLNGRFGNFEYWNMDKVLEESKKLSERLNEEHISKK